MACGHKVLLLLDTAGGAAGLGPVRRAALRLLTYLSCRFGLAQVHWASKFFDSQGARSRPSRGSDFRELGTRSWEDFEEELEARLGERARGAHLPGPAPRAVHTHGALMETLLDYQWDRPEITSPTKPVLRSCGRRLLDAESEAKEAEAALGGFVNAVFLLAPCPRSERELQQFVSGFEAEAQSLPPASKQVMEKLLPKRVQEVMIARKITLYWVDTTEWSKLWESPDHIGYWTVCELLRRGGGTVLPSETFSWTFTEAEKTMLRDEGKPSSTPHLSPWIPTLPADATINRLLCNFEYEASFPQMEGTLFLPLKGKEVQETWTVTLEPLVMHQRHFQKPVRIFLKGTVAHWSLPMCGTLGTDSWMLQSPEENQSTQRLLFQQLVSRLTAEELHLVASVDPGEGWPPITGVISPLSPNAMILTVFHTKEAEFQRHFLHTVVARGPQDTTSLFSDVLDGILNQTHNSFEDPSPSGMVAAAPVPEWAQQELGRTIPWNPAIVEKWFPFSNSSGASSNLMESFWLLQAASANKEESSKTESELTRCLSELYQRKSREESIVNQEDSKKKRGIPRTPVRQKMNTMCRSLKMLNVARLNVKAQKLHPDGSPDVPGEKGIPKMASGRTLRSSKPKDFKTEEELLSYIHENYQKTVDTGEMLYSCAQNLISTIKVFLKSKGTKELEVNCLNHIKSNLLKTSKSLRQNLGKKLDKEDKVRECQLQVFLHLEMCLQCPSVLESMDEMEQVVEEVTNLLRTVCVTEDSAYVAKFLEEILRLYIDSIPETLGHLYHSLGFVIPQKLAGVLPTDFFSDDSMTQESKSPFLSGPLSSSAHSSVLGGTESDQLEELRTRSAKKRKNAFIRHKSIAEVSQNLRQIEIPKVSRRATKNENPAPQQPVLSGKDTGQEVTKVRRNLFNQQMLSPSKRSLRRGLPRSHSVSAMEGLDHKLSNFKKTKSTTFQGYHKLLTKSVTETPVHKQISRRLLHRQIKGRSSDPGPDINVVEESPEKGEDEVNLRRSPRIKHLSFSRTNSGSFYSASQPKSQSMQRVHSLQQNKSDQRENSPVQSIRSPKSLLFGAVSEVISPSEKGSAKIARPSRSRRSPEIPTAYQTPKKSHQKPPSFSKTTPRRLPRTPQAPLHSPARLQDSPAEMTPVKCALSKKSLEDPSSHSYGPPLASKVTSQKGSLLAGKGASPLETNIPRTPSRPGAQLPGFSPNCTWPHSVNSSPEGPCCPASSPPSNVQPRSECLTPPRSECLTPPSRYSLRTPPRVAALLGTPQNQKHQQSCLSRASQAVEPTQALKATVETPERPGSTTLTSSPPVSPKELFTFVACDVPRSPLKSSTASPPPGEWDWKEPQISASTVASLSYPVPSTPHRIPQHATSDPHPPPPPSKLRRCCRKTSDPDGVFLECQPSPSAVPVAAHSPAIVSCSRKGQKDGSPSPQSSPKGRSHSSPASGSDWHACSPLLIAGDTEYLTLLDQADHFGWENHDGRSRVFPGASEGPGMVLAKERPSVPGPGNTPPLASSGLSSSEQLYALHCTADTEQRQAAAQLENLPASASPQTYEVELEMQASGLPKLRIKKVDPSAVLKAEAPGQEDSPQEEEGSLLGLSMPRGSRCSSKPEPTYTSPPCLRPSHSTPGKSRGQTYICQSCTPTHGPPSTPSPFQTDTGVPWTPSPKHSGKTTPDTIKDWPRRKRAVDCNTAPPAGRGEASADPHGGLPLPEPEGQEPGLPLSLHKAPILEDSELEGVCQLPDQSPPGDCVPKAEAAFSWEQFGLGSRKRLLSDQEETEEGTKRVCDGPEASQQEEGPLGGSVPPCRSTGDDDVFISSSTSPPSSAVRSCLSASGLQALTQSPLLFQGRTPASQGKDTRDEDVDVFPSTPEESPFHQAFSRRRPFSRTYTRKKLIS